MFGWYYYTYLLLAYGCRKTKVQGGVTSRLSKSYLFCGDKNSVKKHWRKQIRKNIFKMQKKIINLGEIQKNLQIIAVLRSTTNILRRLRTILCGRVSLRPPLLKTLVKSPPLLSKYFHT